MTTDTAPLIEHAVSVDELPALDQHDERTCELLGQDHRACHARAVWALTFRDICGCAVGSDRPNTLLLACDECRDQVETDCQSAQCLECLRYLPLLRAEPLR